MEATQRVRMDSMDLVDVTWTRHNAVWSGMANYAAKVAKVRTEMSVIYALDIISVTDFTGYAVDKSIGKTAGAKAGRAVVVGLIGFAQSTNNNTLKNQIDFSVSDLEGMNDRTFISSLKLLHAHATTHAAAIVAFGTSAGEITALATAIANYITLKPGPTDAADRKQLANDSMNEAIDNLLREMNNDLDIATEDFIGDPSNFQPEYRLARTIHDVAGPSKIAHLQPAPNGGVDGVRYAGLADNQQIIIIVEEGSGTYNIERRTELNGPSTGVRTVSGPSPFVFLASEMGVAGEFIVAINDTPSAAKIKTDFA